MVITQNEKLHAAAKSLREAYVNGSIPPLRTTLAAEDADAAYAIQAINTDHWRRHGRKPVGHKVGLTSRVVQMQLGVSQPDYGVLFADMGVANGGVLHSNRVLQPKVEGEVAVRFRRDVADPLADDAFVRDAIEGAAAAIEIVDSRIADWKITFADTVADNGSSAFFVVADEFLPLNRLDLYSCGMVLEVNGNIASTGAGAACLGSPLNAATWLARTLAMRGTPIRAGDIVLTGALGPMVPLQGGDSVRLTVGGLGTIGFRCE